MGLLSQFSDQESPLAKGIAKGAEAVEKGKDRVRWIEASYHYTVREFRTRWTLRAVSAIVATLGLGAWIFAAYFAMAETMSPSAAAFLLGSGLLSLALLFTVFSLRRVRKHF